MRSDWPVLVVEDTEERIQWFRQRLPKAIYLKMPMPAFEALKLHNFKVIDHDLHWMHVDNSLFNGTGKEVARYLARKGFKGILVIHSRHEQFRVPLAAPARSKHAQENLRQRFDAQQWSRH